MEDALLSAETLASIAAAACVESLAREVVRAIERLAATLHEAASAAAQPPPRWAEASLVELARAWARTHADLASLIAAVEIVADCVRREALRTVGERVLDVHARWRFARELDERMAHRAVDWIRVLRDAYEGEPLESPAVAAQRRRYRDLASLLRGARSTLEGTVGVDYDLAAHHVAVVAGDGRLHARVQRVAERLRARLLSVRAPGGATWIWLGRGSPLDRSHLAALHHAVAEPGGRAGVGEPARGLAGFRTSHLQALDALALARSWETPLATFDDLSLAELAGRDRGRATAFVERELGALLHAGARRRALLDTLRVYLEHGQRAGAAGALRGLHRDTVRKQLAEAERLLGRSLEARSGELLLALRLHALLSL